MKTRNMEIVIIAKNYQGIYQTIEKSLNTLEIMPKELPVVIKPNLCCIKTHETGATTDPSIIKAIINYMKKHHFAKEFYIVESDATALNADVAFQLLGYDKLSRELNVKTVNLTKIPKKKHRFPENLSLHTLKVPKLLSKPHFMISVAKMKTHDMCSLTATLKNMYGCNPEPYKAKYHNRLHENIVDLASVFRPNLSVIDAGVAMEGNGPTSGTPLRLDTLVFGTDPLATDHALTKIMGINPSSVKYLSLARKQKLGTTKYEILGANLEKVRTKFRTGTVTMKLISRMSPFMNLFRKR